MIKMIGSFFLYSLFLLSNLQGADLSCTQEIAKSFFSFKITTEALSLYDIPQSQWTPINQELKNNSKKIPILIENLAKQQPLNPFNTFAHQKEAWELTKTVLFEQFSLSIRKYFSPTEYQLEQMFLYLIQQQLPKLKTCFGKELFESNPKNRRTL